MEQAEVLQDWVTNQSLLPLRRQQAEAIMSLESAYLAGQRRAWVTLPPGAGKTLVGLEIARKLGSKTLILSPNTAIQNQWERASENFYSPALPISKSRVLATPITTLTYQSIASFSIEAEGSDSQYERMHENGKNIIKLLALEKNVTLILDEAHHLLATWGQLLAEILDMLPNATVVGLTGTPPTAMTVRETELIDRILGKVVYEASSNALVRDGNTAPYQDLNLFVAPTMDESIYLVDVDDTRNADRLISHSFAKADGSRRIILAEHAHRQTNLRALILCDYESMSAKVNDDRAGSAMRVLEVLTQDIDTCKLNPVLVTGSQVTCTAHTGMLITQWVRDNYPKINLEDILSIEPDTLVTLKGAWTSSEWVKILTEWFQTQNGHVLIGTRSLLGEGWDAPSVNVVVDLTAAATGTSVAQGRGRGLRIDTKNLKKVASLWSVTCVDPYTPDYAPDYLRLVKKSQAYFTISPHGTIVAGDTLLPSLQMVIDNCEQINLESLAKASATSYVYDLWRIGQGYKDRKNLWLDVASQARKTIAMNYLGKGNFQLSRRDGFTVKACERQKKGFFKTELVNLRLAPETNMTVSLAIAMAVASTLNKAGLISLNQRFVKAVQTPEGMRVWLDTVNEVEAETFRAVLSECFDLSVPSSAMHFPAHAVAREDYERLTHSTLNMAFTAVTSFHPVPKIFATNKELLALFETRWVSFVGPTWTKTPGWEYAEWAGETRQGETWI
jgi:superfamily II DNA or RNA helicase